MRGWFRRVFGGGESGPPGGGGSSSRWWHADFPDWAAVMRTPDRFAAFMDAVERYFVRRKMVAMIQPEGVVVMAEGSPLPGTLGLANLMQSCALHELDEWNGLVAAHFDAIARSHAQRDRYDAQVKEWGFVSPRLRIRLWDKEEAPQLPHSVLSEDIPGLLTALVVDLPEAIRSVSAGERAGWGRPDRELFRIARDNVLREVQPEARPFDPERPDGLLIVEADSFYTASAALDAERVPGLLGQHGVFFSLPVRHGMLAWRFNALEDVQGIGPLARATRRLFDEGPGSLSPRIWWFRAGACIEVGYESSPEHVAVIPPAALAEYLRDLAQGDAM
jgi:hypothetical protein